jgi:hypothetical protein
MFTFAQFIHLAGYGVKPAAGEPQWSCVECISAEGARVPKASRHIKYRGEPRILHGVSPVEAGRRAMELAPVARDARGRHLRCDGVLLVAGVVSYPMPRAFVQDDPVEQDIYGHWQQLTLEWLQAGFGEYLVSVVEHADEEYLHIHLYSVPKLLPDGQLDLPKFHPGRAMKAAAAEAGASKKDQEAAYRAGMSRWQDDYHYAVSRLFGHARFGAKRTRVSRLERKMQKAMEDDRARQQAALDAAWAEFERKRAEAEAELARRRRQIADAAEHQDQPAADRARLLAAETELAVLRARLAVLEDEARLPLVA